MMNKQQQEECEVLLGVMTDMVIAAKFANSDEFYHSEVYTEINNMMMNLKSDATKKALEPLLASRNAKFPELPQWTMDSLWTLFTFAVVDGFKKPSGVAKELAHSGLISLFEEDEDQKFVNAQLNNVVTKITASRPKEEAEADMATTGDKPRLRA